MRKITKLLAIILLLCIVTSSLASCEMLESMLGSLGLGGPTIDYAAEVKLDMSSETLKQEVTVKTYVDGDTTHFHVPVSERFSDGVMKARYLGIDTPESTGKIEEWGKKASKFTRSKLEGAVSIIVESEDGNWNADSTGDRFLVWVWYKTSEDAEYRNLNIEIIQEGLAIPKSTASTRYGDICLSAREQASKKKLNIHSGKQDPDYFYDDAYQIDLKELRTNTEAYNGAKVAVEGILTRKANNSGYIEWFDEETGYYFGFNIFYGYNLNSFGLQELAVGNKVRLVGTVQYYETGGYWQISGVEYDWNKAMENDPNWSARLDNEKYTPSNVETTAEKFVSKINLIVNKDGDQTVQEYDYAALVQGTSIYMKNLEVIDVHTTATGGDSDGAMTLTCKSGGAVVSVRTGVFYYENGDLMTEEDLLGKTIDVTGLVETFGGSYQIKLIKSSDITFH